jgi:putative DNA primase/helicase
MSADPIGDFRAAIRRELGEAPETIEPGRLRRFATRDRPGDDAGFCKLFDDLRGGVYGCNRQFPGQVFTWHGIDRDRLTPTERAAMARQLEQARGDRDAAQRAQWQTNAGRIAALWGQCVPTVAGDPVALYLAHRLRGELWPLPDCLRLHPALPYRIDGATVGTWPAMVARLSAPDGRLLALHRTWLSTDGEKAPTPGPVKKLTPTAGPLAGACIRLAWPGAAGYPQAGPLLGIGEGIETALAARCASGVPTVAAYSAGALAGWQWPPSLRRLVIFADADPAGAEASDKLRQRARAAGLTVNVMTPTTPGADWCDVWAARKEATV